MGLVVQDFGLDLWQTIGNRNNFIQNIFYEFQIGLSLQPGPIL